MTEQTIDNEPDLTHYIGSTLDTPKEQVIGYFVRRYNCQPERVQKIVKGYWLGREWGWWAVGPIPERAQ